MIGPSDSDMSEEEFKSRFFAHWLKRALVDATVAFELFKYRVESLEITPEEFVDEIMDAEDEERAKP